MQDFHDIRVMMIEQVIKNDMKQYVWSLLLMVLVGLSACSVGDTDNKLMQELEQGNTASSPWRGSFEVDVTKDKTTLATTTLLVTGSQITFAQLPGKTGNVAAYYFHTGSSDTDEYFNLTPVGNLSSEKSVAVYQKKNGLWSGIIVIDGQEYQFNATKRINP